MALDFEQIKLLLAGATKSELEALRGAIDEQILVNKDTGGTAPPLKAGDIVVHPLFGRGIVQGTPVAMVGPAKDRNGNYTLLEDKGWKVTVQWDDAMRGTSDVMNQALEVAQRA